MLMHNKDVHKFTLSGARPVSDDKMMYYSHNFIAWNMLLRE